MVLGKPHGVVTAGRVLARAGVALVIACSAVAQPARRDGGNAGPAPEAVRLPVDVVFVSRQIPLRGSSFWIVPRDMPGVGPHSRVRPAAPGKLLIRERGGTVRTLIDGTTPTAASLNLIDVNAPAVTYDGRVIAFAGLPAGAYDPEPNRSIGAWRIYLINTDGTGLRQLTFSDQEDLDYTQFGAAQPALRTYDDFDPVWLPDGRLAFASTRYPEISHYGDARASNLYVVNADGTRLHRITAERNGADRPAVDPLTGRLVYSRWWRNHRFAIDSMDTIVHGATPAPPGGFDQHLGLTSNRFAHVGGANNLYTNHWHLATVNPDGSDVKLWSGFMRDHVSNAVYGGAFAPDGTYFANFFPTFNMTDAAGFGGVRRYARDAQLYTPVAGITYLTLDYVSTAPISHGVYRGQYVSEPEVLPDGRLVVSRAPDHLQDYGLYIMNADGSNMQPLLDYPGTTELRARAIYRRPLPPIAPDAYRQQAQKAFPSRLPPTAAGPYAGDGTFTFNALNVYFNAPVDTDIISAPAAGSAGSIRFFIDHQRTAFGTFGNLDWPILLREMPVNPDGSVRHDAPANVPLFEQIRSPAPEYKVPLTGLPFPTGAGHVTGMNFAPAGSVAKCVGCHAGHTLIPVPPPQDAKWTNIAPGATVTVSSERALDKSFGLVDRRAAKGSVWQYWSSDPAQPQDGQWARLTFRVPVTVRTVRLYNPRFGDEAKSSVQVESATIRLYADAEATELVAEAFTDGPVSVAGTDIAMGEVKARVVEVLLDEVSGLFDGAEAASLAEIEVIARVEAAE